MVDSTDYFKRNGRQRVFLYTIRYTSMEFLIYAIDTDNRVET
jgi:hypothetical protein